MARLVGVDLPRDKRVEVALTYIFGVGRTTSQKALAATGVDPSTRVKDLVDDQLVALRDDLGALLDEAVERGAVGGGHGGAHRLKSR